MGALLFEDRLPISADAKKLSRRDRRSPLDHALNDGEDYELLFTLPGIQAPKLERSRPQTPERSRAEHWSPTVSASNC